MPTRRTIFSFPFILSPYIFSSLFHLSSSFPRPFSKQNSALIAEKDLLTIISSTNGRAQSLLLFHDATPFLATPLRSILALRSPISSRSSSIVLIPNGTPFSVARASPFQVVLLQSFSAQTPPPFSFVFNRSTPYSLPPLQQQQQQAIAVATAPEAPPKERNMLKEANALFLPKQNMMLIGWRIPWDVVLGVRLCMVISHRSKGKDACRFSRWPLQCLGCHRCCCSWA